MDDSKVRRMPDPRIGAGAVLRTPSKGDSETARKGCSQRNSGDYECYCTKTSKSRMDGQPVLGHSILMHASLPGTSLALVLFRDMSRKRTRAQAFAESVLTEELSSPAEHEPMEETEEQKAARREKELEIWEAVKEEYYEVVDQLPTSLERYFRLIQQLDKQSVEHTAEILPTLQSYASLRRSLIPRATSDNTDDVIHGQALSEAQGKTDVPDISSSGDDEQKDAMHEGVEIPRDTAKASVTPPPSARTARATPSVGSNDSRGLISHLGYILEENVRVSEEKVNLANAAYESVERQIRFLDQAIKEQETSLTLGLRPGTHPTSIVLPDVPVARRGQRANHPNIDSNNVVLDSTSLAERGRPSRKGGHRGNKKSRDTSPPASPLKVTIPAVNQTSNNIDLEPRYCLCHQVSYGQMIGCDNPSCPYEWFHYDCVNVTAPPKNNAKWYCPVCRDSKKGQNKRSGKSR
ncbi:hypothetical protein PUNSTDRAFT_126631 [Punctularia strigosozonata HHB-11173 SS5]|uniref:uncharacterized protein n=1 Tax=Punctularia strigosozonata (strain HHB-11173) TaxID=741275 RepID=UPI00044171AE|nr:uncharacterized protein PUNSTDRAFT_126631 [Punctularia strigosozonata HHB-11173 SS5]EIN07640.1 hypothetical protein PUNSTDRAFT_126631 [Punctularia strigosozonata HHB-11173 SS5]